MRVISPRLYPACVTPFLDSGDVDFASLAKLLSFFKAAGCAGVVLAGTNGEGPSLSAVEKRDLFRRGIELSDGLEVICGISTPSLNEATWLANQADKAGASGLLVMAPGYFRNAPIEGVCEFIERVADSAGCGVLAYNFPKYTGFTFDESVVSRLTAHEGIVGFKDSSGERENLAMFRTCAGPDARLYVGDESLLMDSLKFGWNGSISGAGNLLAPILCAILREVSAGMMESAEAKFAHVLPAILAIRGKSQPVTTKAVLQEWGLISNGVPRLPLKEVSGHELAEELRAMLGLTKGKIGL